VSTDVAAIGPGAWRVTIDGNATIVWTAVEDGGVWVHTDGRVHYIANEADVRRSRARSGSHDLSAPMPATVRAVLVDVGAQVHTGETVLTLEAMKMELSLRAPSDGTVTAIHCRTGDLVQAGVPLVEIT